MCWQVQSTHVRAVTVAHCVACDSKLVSVIAGIFYQSHAQPTYCKYSNYNVSTGHVRGSQRYETQCCNCATAVLRASSGSTAAATVSFLTQVTQDYSIDLLVHEYCSV
jgi:hypothetical protein